MHTKQVCAKPNIKRKATAVLKAASRTVRFIVELVIILVAALLLAFLLRQFLVETYEVPTSSMVSTIEIGDRILSEKVTYYNSEPQKGDIVTFKSPTDGGETILVKRVIATGGDVVDIHSGNLYINGTLQKEEYVHNNPTYELSNTLSGQDISYPYTVPNGYIWVMGDNRTNSSDSRYFGPVNINSVTGKVFFRYWPLDRFGPM